MLVAERDDGLAGLLLAWLRGAGVGAERIGADADLVDAAGDHAAEVVVAGPSMIEAGFEDVVPRLVAHGSRVLAITDDPAARTASLVLLAGASGLLVLDDDLAGELPSAVDAVAAGSSALHPDVAALVLRRWREDQRRTAPPQVVLTPREHDVLRGLTDGLTSRSLASRLGVAEKTIEAHRSRLYAKLGARNQSHAVSIAAERGLL
ncbi:DNA-binding response regulator [Nocardioides mangrovicus]|uniref:DNA-binding response regulator n=1 Tax=Nocardioides mangrovicus TaxID=2478913 RepID=A0A3L8NXY4_9ACTN|nr:response regulator transcription factor [Nocardioides mangrovicus]RLV47497.1 DNA-binding response regulator [Nocardioides mangrovicus]